MFFKKQCKFTQRIDEELWLKTKPFETFFLKGILKCTTNVMKNTISEKKEEQEFSY